MIDFFMVDVKDIQVNTTDHNFSPAIIENLANAILASGGLIKPLILKQVGLQSYQLIDGHLEYYAALQAKAKDPRKGEMVNAFVISPDEEDLVRQQVSVLQSVYSVANPIETETNTPTNTLPLSKKFDQDDQSQQLASNNNLSVTDYTYLQSQLDAKLEAKFSHYSQTIQSQLRQNQQDLQIALQKIQSAWEVTLNNQLRQQQEAIQTQLRSLSSLPVPVTIPGKINDPSLAVQEKLAVAKSGLSSEKANIKKININEVQTIEDFKKLKEQYSIRDLGPARIKAIINFRQKLDSRITSLDQLLEAGSGISQGMINEWSRYLTC